MKKILALLAVAGFAVPALAQSADFASVDADQSGTVTAEELQAAMPDVTQEQFVAADADQSGDLSEEEFQAISS